MIVTPATLVKANVSAPMRTGSDPGAPIAAGELPRWRDHSVAPVRGLNPCKVTSRPLNTKFCPVASTVAVPAMTHRTANGWPLSSCPSDGHPYRPTCRHSSTPSVARTPNVSIVLRLIVLLDGLCTDPIQPTYTSPNRSQSQPESELTGVLLSLATSSFHVTMPVASFTRSMYSGPRLPGSSRPPGPRLRPAP